MSKMWTGMAALCLVAGCGGEVSNFNTSNTTGRAFSETASAVAVDLGSGSSTSNPYVSVDFVDENTAYVSVGSTSTTMFRASDGTYSDVLGNNELIIGTQLKDGPVTPDMLYFTLLTFDGSGSAEVAFFVDGNRTLSANLPSSFATYSGVVKAFDQAFGVGAGTIDLNVDFSSGQVGGQITGAVPGNPSAALTIDPALFGGTSFNTTLSSSDVTVTASHIDGQFFGPNADQVGGDLSLEMPGQYAAGYYGAKR